MYKKSLFIKFIRSNEYHQWRFQHSQLITKEKLKPHKMFAWQIHSYGDLNELQLTKARIPPITRPTDMLVKVHAASVNPIDCYMINGYGKTVINLLRENELEFPLTLGRDFSGTIINKGHSVNKKFNIGDKVYGIIPAHKQGSHSQVVLVNEAYSMPHPTHLKPVEATSLLYTAMTAWSALYITGELLLKEPARCTILVLGASGGVGTVATQILKSQYATVVCTCSSDAVPLVTSLGADGVFDYTSSNYIENVAKQAKYDIILDCAKVGVTNLPATWKYKKYITLNSPLLINTDKYGLLGGMAVCLSNLLTSNLTSCPNGKSVRWGFFLPSKDGLTFVDKLIKAQKLVPVIHKTYKFEELPKAYQTVTGGHLRGKVVIDMQTS